MVQRRGSDLSDLNVIFNFFIKIVPASKESRVREWSPPVTFGEHSQGVYTRPLISSAPEPHSSSAQSHGEHLAGSPTPFAGGGSLQVQISPTVAQVLCKEPLGCDMLH